MLPKLCLADSKFVVTALTKIFAIRPDVIAGSPQNLTIQLSVTQQVADILEGRHRDKSCPLVLKPKSTSRDKRREKRDIVRFRVPKKEFTGYQP